MAEALEQLFIDFTDEKTGKKEKLPALDPSRREDVGFTRYHAPPLDLKDRAAYEEWVERCTFIEDDLHWLLQQPHDKFWCQVIFDETLLGCVDSYLKYGPRSYDIVDVLPVDSRKKHENIRRLFFMVCLRMSTHKESKDHFITPSVFGDIVYENYIFDIPKLLDLCVLYGATNTDLVTKMVANVFDKQIKYQDDLLTVVPTILSVFHDIQTKCGLKVECSFSPEKLTPNRQSLISMSLEDFQDVVLFLSDTTHTLLAFLEIYPKGAVAFSHHNFPLSLADMYENLIPVFNEAFRTRDWSETVLKPAFVNKVRLAQKHLLKIFRHIIMQTYFQPIMENRKDIEDLVEGLMELMTSMLGERRFTAHYDRMFPFAEDKEILSQSAYTIDDTRLLFLESGFHDAQEAYPPKQRKPSPATMRISEMAAMAAAQPFTDVGAESASRGETRDEECGACAPRVGGIQLESLISSVKDLFPDLGEGFIEACLEEYGYTVEKVINAVLEDRLPPSLASLDRNLPRQSAPLAEEEDVLSERRNIYDNDEFDLFNRRDVDLTKIHKGKKERGLNMSILDKKEELKSVKELYERYGSEDVESMYDTKYIDEYEDEYDDTYDENNVGAGDADSAEELNTVKPFNVRRMPSGPGGKRHHWESEESSEEEEGKPRDLFIEDPAKVRERQAQRRAARAARQGRRPPAQQDQGQGRFDVKGKPKGQGQEKDVSRNRAFKEKNKATRVHHNRKNLADKKRKL